MSKPCNRARNAPKISPISDTERMTRNVYPSECSEVPRTILTAERWRVAGSRLRELSPEMYDQIFAMLVASLPDDSEEVASVMPQSYLPT